MRPSRGLPESLGEAGHEPPCLYWPPAPQASPDSGPDTWAPCCLGKMSPWTRTGGGSEAEGEVAELCPRRLPWGWPGPRGTSGPPCLPLFTGYPCVQRNPGRPHVAMRYIRAWGPSRLCRPLGSGPAGGAVGWPKGHLSEEAPRCSSEAGPSGRHPARGATAPSPPRSSRGRPAASSHTPSSTTSTPAAPASWTRSSTGASSSSRCFSTP